MLLWNQASADPIKAAEAIQAREARLLGLDMPTKAAVTDPDGNGIPGCEHIKEAVAAAHTSNPGCSSLVPSLVSDSLITS
jgi:hypothetical protein